MQHATRNPPLLEARIVCFIDILGFASLVADASSANETKAQLVDDALGYVQAIEEMVTRRKGTRPDVHIFSDCAIVSTEVSRNAVNALLDALAELTWKLMCLGIKIRGAVTVGKMSSNRDRPWGPAIVEAYRLENTVAIHPRIVLHGRLMRYITKNASDILGMALLQRDTGDGVYFLNAFAHRLGQHLPAFPEEPPLQEIEAIRDHLSEQHEGLTEAPNIYRKIAWLRQLWDAQFSPHAELGRFQTRHGHEHDPVRIYRDALDRELQNGVVIDAGTFDDDYSQLSEA